MTEDFIPWPDFVICPKCKNKVDIPKSWRMFELKPKKRTTTCPDCKTEINYFEPGVIDPSI